MTDWQKLRLYGFSKRESDVALELVKGGTNQKIADRLFIGRDAIAWHITSMNKKFKTKSRQEIAEIVKRVTSSEVMDDLRVDQRLRPGSGLSSEGI